MAFTRSTTGCFACKTKRKKCDETKPHCLRCQKSRTQCPGYTYVQNTDKPHGKLRTLPAPRTVIGQSRTAAHKEISLTDTEERGWYLYNYLPLKHDVVSETKYTVPGTSVALNAGPSGAVDISNGWTSNGPLQHTSTNFDLHPPIPTISNPHSIKALPSMGVVEPMTSGQASLLAALFSLSQPPGLDPPPQRPQLLASNIDLVLNGSLLSTERRGNYTTDDQEDSDGIVSVIRRELVLDKTTESNALPFVLHSYAAWVQRIAFEPVKLNSIARDFVYNQFEDGEQSRLIISLLANVGNRIGDPELAEREQKSRFSELYSVIRQRLAAVKSRPYPQIAELAKVLDSAMEVIVMHLFVSSIRESNLLMQEVVPIVRRLSSEPHNPYINLVSLFYHPLGCLRHYARMDILFSMVADTPTLLQYEVTVPAQPSNPPLSVAAVQCDDVLQWLYGAPPGLLFLFARMKLMRQDGLAPNTETISALERDICELEPYSGSASEQFLMVMRFVLSECWKQTAYIYLYMAVCGDSSDTPRVKKALKQYIKLLGGIKPGHTPDEFLVISFYLVSVAAQRKQDREVIKQRYLGLNTNGRPLQLNSTCLSIVGDYWARADAEGRPIMWSDVAVSRKRVLGV